MPSTGEEIPVDVVNISRTPPKLERPVLIAAFGGWNDAGEAATAAVRALSEQLRATVFAGIDPEEFFDFQLVRPMVRLDDARERAIDWPLNQFGWADLDGTGRHVVLLEGTEPSLRWRAFTEGIVALARQLGVELVVTLGALQVDLPHTRPVRVTGTASNPELADRYGLRPSTYEGPTGITGILHASCVAAGLDALSLWAGVPHYLAGTPYVAAALTLAQRTLTLLGAEVSLRHLAEDAAAQRDDIEGLVAEDEDLAAYVVELEERVGEDDDVIELQNPVVSGDELAAEFERYLRERE
jgi:proteasome assembly chaperone (PAC2) family protein